MGKPRLHRNARINRAVFLDRDGVINRVTLRDGRPYPPASLNKLEFLAGVAEAIEILRSAGFIIIVVTNQPDVATGAQQQTVVEEINRRIKDVFLIDDLQVCYHVDLDGCTCRKPKPGMILTSQVKWSLDLKNSFMVGDRWRDIEAGQAAGCQTIFVDAGYSERKPKNPDATVTSLLEASRLIISENVKY